MTMTRNEFLRSMFGAVAGAAGVALLVGCGGDEDSPADAAAVASCTNNGTSVEIGTNHGHALTVSKEDVTAGAEKTYDITGSSPHAHSVTITAAMFGMLKSNTSIMVLSSTGGNHTHNVTVTCM